MNHLDHEYHLMKQEVDKLSKVLPPNLIAPVKNIFLLHDMKDSTGRIQVALGNCEVEVLGEREIIGHSLQTKVKGLSLW